MEGVDIGLEIIQNLLGCGVGVRGGDKVIARLVIGMQDKVLLHGAEGEIQEIGAVFEFIIGIIGCDPVGEIFAAVVNKAILKSLRLDS